MATVLTHPPVIRSAKTTPASPGAMMRLLPLYYVLAVFGLFTVAMSLYLNHRIMAIYSGSVEVNQRWARRLSHYSELGQLAAAVDEPPNDVFNSHDVAAESAATRSAHEQFDSSLTAQVAELRRNANEAGVPALLEDFEAVHVAMRSMMTEAAQLFSYYADNQVKAAGERMATMDRRFGDVNVALARLRTHVAGIQKQRFDQQIAEAATLQKYEYLVAVLVVVMVGGTTAYGYKLGRRETVHQRELQRHLASLRDAEERLAAIIGSAMVGIISLDENHRVVLFNAAAESIFRCSAADVIGKPLDRLLPERFHDAHRQHVHRYSATGVTARSMRSPGTLYGRRATGEEFPLEATISRAKIGGQTLLTVILRDLTERKQAEELARLYAKSKELDQLRTEFIYNLTHELRTPLTTIREGVSQVTEGILGTTTADQREFLEIVLTDIDRLSRIINDLLDEAKIEAGRLELARERANIVAIARQEARLFTAKAQAKGLELLTDFPESEVDIYIDPDKIAQVFANLLGNALKFTERGYVQLIVQDMGEHVSCAVRDTGRGIAADDIPKVFQKFYQANRTPVAGGQGTGLGLPIAKAIVESHGGAISATSDLNVGSTFTFVIPKTPA